MRCPEALWELSMKAQYLGPCDEKKRWTFFVCFCAFLGGQVCGREGDTGAVYSTSIYQSIQAAHDFLGANVLEKYHRFAVKKCSQQGNKDTVLRQFNDPCYMEGWFSGPTIWYLEFSLWEFAKSISLYVFQESHPPVIPVSLGVPIFDVPEGMTERLLGCPVGG